MRRNSFRHEFVHLCIYTSVTGGFPNSFSRLLLYVSILSSMEVLRARGLRLMHGGGNMMFTVGGFPKRPLTCLYTCFFFSMEVRRAGFLRLHGVGGVL